jgi:hypothetical protein
VRGPLLHGVFQEGGGGVGNPPFRNKASWPSLRGVEISSWVFAQVVIEYNLLKGDSGSL